MLFCFQIQLIVCNAPQHLQCVASATQFHKLFHYGHPVVFPVGSPEGCPVESPDGSLRFGSVFEKPINLEMTKASVCQTTQSATFLPSYIIALPHTHTHTHREHTERDTHTDTRPHTQCCCMLANVSTYMHTQCLFCFCSLASGSTSQCPVPKQDTGCLGSVCTRPTPPLGQLTDPPYKVLIFVLQKKPGIAQFQVLELGHLLEHVKLGLDPPDILSQCNGFSVQPTVLLTHSLAKPMHIASVPIFKYLVEVLECPCILKYMPSMVCLVPVIELLGQPYTKWCQVPCLCCLLH